MVNNWRQREWKTTGFQKSGTFSVAEIFFERNFQLSIVFFVTLAHARIQLCATCTRSHPVQSRTFIFGNF